MSDEYEYLGDPEIMIDQTAELLPVIDLEGFGSPEVMDVEDSPSFRWNGASLVQRIGGALPIVYGRHILAPTLINAYIEEGEHDTINLLLAWGEGEIESISNIKINGNPIENYYGINPNDPYGQGAEITTKNGSLNQTPIQGFNEIHNISAVTTTLQKAQPYIFTGLISTAKAFKLEFSIDRLYQKDLESSNILSWTMVVQVEIKKRAESEYKYLGNIDINKKTTSTFKRYLKTEYMDEGLYDIRITKLSDNQDEGLGALKFGEITLSSIDEITTEDLSYPSVAVSGIRLMALQDLQGNIPNILGLCTGKKVRIPKVTHDLGGLNVADWEEYYYDPAATRFKRFDGDAVLYWDGVTYIEAWSANPFWCLRDLLLNKRYGLGDFIATANINEASFLECALYADGTSLNDQGKKEKRFRLDMVFDYQYRAPDAISIILKACRGIIFHSDNQIKVAVEKPESSQALFSSGNILSGSFQLRYLSKRVPNVLAVDYINKDKNYLRDRIELASEEQTSADIAPRSQSVSFLGVTRLTQVIRESRIMLNKLINNQRTITFSAFFDAVLLQPYDVIDFQHDVPSWGAGGRIDIYNSNTIVNLDKAVIIESGKSYELKVRNPLSDQPETRPVISIPGVYQSLEVSPAFSFTPQENDLWALGEIGVEIQQYRITGLSKNESGVVGISAVEYNADVYSEESVVIPKDIYKHISLDIPNAQNLELSEINNRLPNGSVETKLQVSFKIPPISSKYLRHPKTFEVWVSDNQGASWNYSLNTDKEFYVIPDLVSPGVTYTVAIVSVLESGEKNPISASPQQTRQVIGLQEYPAPVQNFSFTFTDEIQFHWDKNLETDIEGYEVRTKDDNWLSEGEGLIWRGNATTFTLMRPGARSGIRYYIRAYNQYGYVSSSASSIEPTNPKPPAPQPVITNLFQKVFITWAAVADNDIQYYEIWRNDTDQFFGVEQNNEQLVAREPATQFVASIPYDPTYFRVCAVDRFGRGDFSYVIKVDQVLLGNGVLQPGSITGVEIRDDSITAAKIVAGSITAGKLAVGSVTATNIDVEELSAISAVLGTIVSGTIIGALIKTSPDVFRVELDSIGLRSYDELGRRTFNLERGKLCLIDPTCQDYYSYLDSGGLILHTPYGDNPYATRICSGVANSGSVVCLHQWKSKPEIMLGIKKLKSYDSRNPESDQEWCVYHDNLQYYDFGSSNFGWCFDIHAQLRLTGGTRPTCTYNSAFNVIKTTGANVCSAVVTALIQVWCHQASPDPVCYGCVCYTILYRKVGDVTWCCKSLNFSPPHNTCADIQTTYSVTSTVNFGESGTYDVALFELGRHYVKTEFASGYASWQSIVKYHDVDYSKCLPYAGDDSITASIATAVNGSFQSCACRVTYYLGIPAPAGQILDVHITYSYALRLVARYGYGTYAAAGATIAGRQYGYSPPTLQDIWQQDSTGSGSASTLCIPVSLSVEATSSYQPQYERASAQVTLCFTYSFFTCICDVRQVPYNSCECVWSGSPDSRNYLSFYSMADITSANTVLDPNGEISYLAVAYR